MPLTVAAIIAAAGSGSRMGASVPKQFLQLAGLPILVHTLRALQNIRGITTMIVAVAPEHKAEVHQLIAGFRLGPASGEMRVVDGGRTRQESVGNALATVPADTEVVLVHDGARPLVAPALIEACLTAAHTDGAAMAAIRVNDTLKEVTTKNQVVRTINREQLWRAQTPQAARTSLLKEAFAKAAASGFCGTDEAGLLEHLGVPITVVEGSSTNIKITRPEDLAMAEAILAREQGGAMPACRQPVLRMGHGYDAHALVSGRSLVLGGVTVPHHLGLLGHSDADVVTHALCDALLGAIGEGDIGRHFPDTDQRYKDVRSIGLLEKVVQMADARGFSLVNADLTVIAQQPRLAPYLPAMREILAAACRVDPGWVNIKATTTEKMGFAGREEGIAAHAVVLLQGR